MKNKKWKEEGS